MCGGLALSAIGVLPKDCATYDFVWRNIMPLAAALMMLEHDISRLLAGGAGTLLAAFLLGAVGMSLGALVGWQLLGGCLGPHGAPVAACMLASYVGGTINFLAVAQVLNLPAAALPGAFAADNIAMALLLAVLFAVPSHQQPAPAGTGVAATIDGAAASTSVDAHAGRGDGDASDHGHAASGGTSAAGGFSADTAAMSLAAAATAAALGPLVSAQLGVPGLNLLLVSLAATALSVLGNAASRSTFAGATSLGTALMQLFFATIGATCGSLSSLAESGPLVAFIFVMCSCHWALLAAASSLLKLPLRMLLIASNAGIGGPATAAGMAASRGWTGLVQPAMLVGCLGYAIGTGAGLGLAHIIIPGKA